jgi:hypothetical protein
MYAECRTDCAAARSRFEAEYQAKYPKAVESLTANWESGSIPRTSLLSQLTINQGKPPDHGRPIHNI